MIDRSTPQILMCRPEFYGIHYEINPWMSRLRQSDRPTAEQQWSELRDALEAAGATISLLPPVEGLPDMVFTANAALIYGDRAVMAHFRHPERQGEVAYDEAWLREAGFCIEHVPDDLHFEGAGDALFCGDTLFAGYRIRSAARGHQQIGEMLGCRVIPLELVDPYYYHLDTCFCPLAPGQAIYFPQAFDRYGRDALAAHVPDLIAVDESERAPWSPPPPSATPNRCRTPSPRRSSSAPRRRSAAASTCTATWPPAPESAGSCSRPSTGCSARPTRATPRCTARSSARSTPTAPRTRPSRGALAQCASDLIELAAAVYGIDLTARRRLSVRALAAAFAAFRWGGILRQARHLRHGVPLLRRRADPAAPEDALAAR